MVDTDAAPPVLLRDVRKRFGAVEALRGVDLTVGPGEIHGLLGPNGAGKTTLLRILFGLIRPDRGTVELFGRSHTESGPALALRQVAGFVDRPRYYPYLTARQALGLLAAMDGFGHPPIHDVLGRVGLHGAADRRLNGWSTGMLQRLGIAAALLRSPRLLILDEPAEGLDPAGARDLRTLLRSLAAEGVAVLISSHDMPEVESICGRVTILHRGLVARSGPLEELRAGAPHGSHRLLTSDDQAARALAVDYGLTVTESDGHGFSVDAGPSALDALVCGLGKADVAVRRIDAGVDPLSALFFELTDPAAFDGPFSDDNEQSLVTSAWERR